MLLRKYEAGLRGEPRASAEPKNRLSGQFPDEHARDLAENWVSSIGPGVITNALERISPVRLMVCPTVFGLSLTFQDLTLYQTFQQHRSTHIRGQLLAGLLTR